MDNEHKLSETWVLWYHRVNDNNWTEDSYTRLCEINTVEDFWKVMNTIEVYSSGMFFLMRGSIFPRWEDINNIGGGYWSFRISKNESDEAWENVLVALIGNTLTKDINDMELVNGVSISPKINNCIIKVWNNDYNKCNVNMLNSEIPKIVLKDAFYQKHEDQNDFKM